MDLKWNVGVPANTQQGDAPKNSDTAFVTNETVPAVFSGHLLQSVRVAPMGTADAGAGAMKVALPTNRGELLQFVLDWERKHASAVKLGVASLLILPLAACAGGGGGGSSSGPGGTSGVAIDGHLSGASVARLNNRGNSVTTHSDGTYTGLTGTGAISVAGGVDIATGLPFTGLLTAPAGATAITPLTTVIQSLIETGMTPSDATARVLQAFGLNPATDVLHVDPVATGNVALFNAGAQVATMMTMISSAMTGGATAANAGLVADALANALSQPGVTLATLDMHDVLGDPAIGPHLTANVGQLAQLLAATNDQIAASTSIAETNGIQTNLQGAVATQIVAAGLDGGDLGQVNENNPQLNLAVAPTVNAATPSPTTIDLSGVTFTGWTDGADHIRINGSSGADTLIGSNKADALEGGAGSDTLTGGAGHDVFRFTFGATSDSPMAARDHITDFVLGNDLIDLIEFSSHAAVAAMSRHSNLDGSAGGFNLGTALTASFTGLAAHEAAIVVVVNAGAGADGNGNRVFLCVNDSAAPLSAAADLCVEMTGMDVGTLGAVGALAPDDYFLTAQV